MPNSREARIPPRGWKRKSLTDVASVAVSNVDKKFRPRERSVRLCNYVDVYRHERVDDSVAFMVATASEAEIGRFGLSTGDVVITKDSETPDDIGIPTVVGSIGSDVVCGYHLALIRPHEVADPTFLAKQLAAERTQRYYAIQANGTTRYGLSIASIGDTPVWLPELAEQRRIAEILDTLDEAIRKTEQVIAKLDQVKQGLLHDLLTRGIDPTASCATPCATRSSSRTRRWGGFRGMGARWG